MLKFDYVAPKSVDEAIAALAAGGEKARPLSGGTDLIAQLQEGRNALDTVVDVKRIPELMEISRNGKGLRIGAAVPCHQINHNQAVQDAYPALLDSTHLIGGTQIQGRASLGGNLCNASPAADSVPNLIVHHVLCHIAGPNGQRNVPVEEFCTGPGQNVLGKGELLVSLAFPQPPANFGAAYLRFIPRNEMDIAVVGAGASLVLNDEGDRILSARVALGAVAPIPLLVEEVGDRLAGQAVSEAAFDTAAEIAREAARPINDMRGTIAQRKHLSAVLTRRALRIALDRARGTRTVDALGRLNENG